MKQTLFAAAIMAALAAPAAAQTYPTPFPLPPDNAQEAANKAVVTGWTQMLSQGLVKEAFAKYISPNFREHSELVIQLSKKKNPGYNEVLGFMLKDNAAGGLKPKNGMVIAEVLVADQDMVTMYGQLGADVFRVKNGKITDHWDAAAPTSAIKLVFPMPAGQ
jgi:predicted SnoaL-like aldol condensation-catalyzing enzyme